jgi:hypothetical protein
VYQRLLRSSVSSTGLFSKYRLTLPWISLIAEFDLFVKLEHLSWCDYQTSFGLVVFNLVTY